MNSKKSSKSLSQNEIVFYETENGKVTIPVRFEYENIWLTQKQMAELFGCSTDNISLHLKNIYLESELSSEATTENFSVVQEEGDRSVTRNILFYAFEAIIAKKDARIEYYGLVIRADGH